MTRIARAVAALSVLIVLSLAPAAGASPGWVTPVASLPSAGSSIPEDVQVVSDPQGDTAVVWLEGGSIWESERPAGGSFTAPSKITTAGSETLNPTNSVAITSGGLIYVFFLSNGGGSHTDVASKQLGSTTWSVEELEIHSNTNPPVQPVVGAVTPSGEAVGIWVEDIKGEFNHAVWRYAMKPRGSSTWSAAANIGGEGDAFEGSQPALAMDPNGDAVFAYSSNASLSHPIAAASSLDAGAPGWTAPAGISDGSQSLGGGLAVAIDAKGTATAAWARNNGANNIVQFATRSLGKAWEAAPAGSTSTPGPNDLSPLGTSAGTPSIAIEPDGTTTVAWVAGDSVNERTRPGSGGAFNAATTIASTETFPEEGQVALAAGADGSMVALWDAKEVVSAARRAPGAATFSAAPNLPGTADTKPSGAADNQGNVGVAWVNRTSFPFVVQATGLAVAPPTISNLVFPSTAIAGAPFAYSATLGSDRWSPVTGLWNFGDGTTGPLAGMKTYTGGGSFTATLTASDSVGNTTTVHMPITVTVATSPGGKGPAAPGGNAAPSVLVAGSAAISAKTGTGSATFTCDAPAGESCVISGKLEIAATKGSAAKKSKPKAPIVVGTFSGTIAGGKIGKIVFKLNKTGRALLKRKHKLKVVAIGSSKDHAGQSVKIDKQITLTLRKK